MEKNNNNLNIFEFLLISKLINIFKFKIKLFIKHNYVYIYIYIFIINSLATGHLK